MKPLLISCVTLLCTASSVAATTFPHASAEPDSLEQMLRKILDPSGVDISGQWFIAFEAGENSGEPRSDFFVHRGYINFRKEILPGISGRITPDISVDREGDGEGDLEMRLKYCFVNARLPDFSVFTRPEIEFGLVGRPWLAFEQKINRYRVQGHMYMESFDILNSADFGAQVTTQLGGTVDKDFRKEVSSAYPGRYGSFTIGVFNGGGYHAIERNINKSIEARLTLRPLADIIPGLQFTYAGALGKGNTDRPANWDMHLGFVSFEHQRVVLTGTYFSGRGDYKNKSVDDEGNAVDKNGYSAFCELLCQTLPVSLIARYDRLTDRLVGGDESMTRIIGGLAWRLTSKNKLLLDYEKETDFEGTVLLEILKFSVEFGF
jgi:hypothetical protein